MADLTHLWRFYRPPLAAKIADRALARERIALFGPRQTGKTSLLLEEVVPLLAQQRSLPIYIECWADRVDPLASINHALSKALTALAEPKNPITRALKSRVRKVSVAGASLEMADAARKTTAGSKYLLFDELLQAILAATKKPLVLIFDEFQAIAAAKDSEAIAASLRAALTQASKRVGAIFSGSSETELLQLFASARASLFGFANPEAYPLLAEDFVAHVVRKFRDATGRELAHVDASRVLGQLGHQPAAFLHAVGNMMANRKWTLDDGVRAMLDARGQNRWSVQWFALTPLQRATLRAIAEGRAATAEATKAWMAAELGVEKVAGSSITSALEALHARALIGADYAGSARRYAVIDPVMAAWLAMNTTAPIQD